MAVQNCSLRRTKKALCWMTCVAMVGFLIALFLVYAKDYSVHHATLIAIAAAPGATILLMCAFVFLSVFHLDPWPMAWFTSELHYYRKPACAIFACSMAGLVAVCLLVENI